MADNVKLRANVVCHKGLLHLDGFYQGDEAAQGLESCSSAFGASPQTDSLPHTPNGGLNRAERTAGVPAVSGGIRQDTGRGGLLLPVPPQTNSKLPFSTSFASLLLPSPSIGQQTDNGCYVQQWTCNRAEVSGVTRVVGFGKLKHLLQPEHPFFKDKWGMVKHWARYLDKVEGFEVVYPRVKTFHRENPFRRYQLNRQCSARAAKAVFCLIEKFNLPGFRIIDIETTLPGTISSFLSGWGARGRDMAWGLNNRFWQAVVAENLVGIGHARRSNLHTWSTENPLESHYHFHELLSNYEAVGRKGETVQMPGHPCPKCGQESWVKMGPVSWQCAVCYPVKQVPILQKREWSRQRGGTLVPWGDRELLLIKALWLDELINFARRYCIDDAWSNQAKLFRFQRRWGIKGLVRLLSLLARAQKGLVDVYVSFVKLNSDFGRAKFVNKLCYNGRHPIEDYAVYSNHHPDCAEPGDFISHYDNKARLFGWWRDVKTIVVIPKDREKQKLSPYNARAMEYLGKWYMSELLESTNKGLVGVNIIRGSPIEYRLTMADLEWLQKVEFHPGDV